MSTEPVMNLPRAVASLVSLRDDLSRIVSRQRHETGELRDGRRQPLCSDIDPEALAKAVESDIAHNLQLVAAIDLLTQTVCGAPLTEVRECKCAG